VRLIGSLPPYCQNSMVKLLLKRQANILFNSTRPTKGTDRKRYDQKLQNSVFFVRSWITNYLKYRCVSRSNNFCIDTCVHFFSGLKCKKNLVASNQVRCEKVELSHSSIKLYETQHSLP
jgi:hypothetical protein